MDPAGAIIPYQSGIIKNKIGTINNAIVRMAEKSSDVEKLFEQLLKKVNFVSRILYSVFITEQLKQKVYLKDSYQTHS